MSLGAWFARYGAWIAALGAVVATAGDCGQLWTVNAARPELHLPAPPPGLIVPATLAGTLGIPLYGLGYFARARRDRRQAPSVAAIVMLAGAVFAALGGTVHAATGLAICRDAGGIASGLDPLQGILAAGPLMVSLWGLATAAFVVAGIAEATLPQRWVARLGNPLLLTIVITAAAPLTGVPWRDFVGPASVNLAHILFFLRVAVRECRLGTGEGGVGARTAGCVMLLGC